MNATSRTIARIAGPTAVALAVTEALNMHIYAAQTAPVVYLNGTLLLVSGVAIIQSHNRWRWGWPLLVTLVGWGVAALGLVRMIAPDAPQLRAGGVTDAVFVALVVVGGVLSVQGYRPAGEAPTRAAGRADVR